MPLSPEHFSSARLFTVISLLVCVLFSVNILAQEPQLQFTKISGITNIVDIANAGDDSGRLFLVNQRGLIIIHKDGEELEAPFLNISSIVLTNGEQGLLSLAFAPDFKTSGYFYVWYTGNGGGMILARFKVSDDPDRADPTSRELVLIVAQPFANHNGGRLQFGPDGMLYLGLGDGGGANDPNENGQDGNTLLGKLIRIDVDPTHGNYAIPGDNPFTGNGSVRNEIWALGLRNPWKISFDRGTGDLFIADVGQNKLEEVNFQAASSMGGENYGWDIMEGSQCAGGVCNKAGLTLPVAEYDHDNGCSITGGEVYRGKAYPNLIGVYLFGDYCSGNVWGLSRNGSTWSSQLLADTSYRITTFGLAEDGSVYVVNQGDGIYLISDGNVVSEDLQINAGHSGAWYNSLTSGQGQLIDVVPESQYMFLAWFTFTAAASNNPDQQHWYTAQGNYSGNTAELILSETLGGQFDDPQETSTSPVGTVTVSFTDCEQGQMVYSIDTDGRQGTIPLQRLLPGSGDVCEDQSGNAAITTEAVDINAGMDGAWVNEDTLGQGFMIDAHPNPEGGNYIFVAWFTYGDDTASGQRWLTAQGNFAGSTAEIDIHETTGGRFDDPQLVDTDKVGTLIIDFTDCSNALLSYSLTDDDLAGDMEISRLIPGGQALCEELAGAE